MESKTTDFLGLIKGPRQYRIPSFQRAYSWEKEQRETLWLDILGQYEKLKDVMKQENREELLRNIPGHYLGTIVLAGPSALGVPKSDVIDGQQRITTCLLLLCALRDVRARGEARKPGSQDERLRRGDMVRRRIARRYLINEDEEGTDRLRVVPLSADRKAFAAVMEHDGDGQLSPESLGLGDADSKRILQAYKFFNTELRRQQTNNAPQLARYSDLFPLDLEILEEVITRRLTVITIETANLDDVNAIFESLNATGRPLTQLDLLRNYIFMSLHTRAEQALGKYWTSIEAHLHQPAEIESLIWADVVSRGTPILQKRTYRTVQAEIRQAGGTADVTENYLKDLARKAAFYGNILHPERESSPELARSFRRLGESGGSTAFPLILWLLEQRHNGHINNSQVVEGIALIESFLVRRLISGLPPNNHTSMFGSMLARLHTDVFLAMGDVLERFRAAMLANGKDWPSDDVVAAGVERVDFYHSQRASQRMLILSSLDHHLAPTTVLNYGLTDDSIEHILPQKNTDSAWSSDLAELGETLGDVQEKWLHTLPNLTVVTPLENQKLGSKRFADKVVLYADSQYKLTRDLATFRNDITDAGRLWGSMAMRARASLLTELVCSVWPRPSSSSRNAVAIQDPASLSEFDEDEGEELLPYTSIVEDEV